MNHRWGTVTETRDKKPEVEVSFNRGDERAMEVISRWFGMSLAEFKKVIPPKK